jgi:hypothetical protein
MENNSQFELMDTQEILIEIHYQILRRFNSVKKFCELKGLDHLYLYKIFARKEPITYGYFCQVCFCLFDIPVEKYPAGIDKLPLSTFIWLTEQHEKITNIYISLLKNSRNDEI